MVIDNVRDISFITLNYPKIQHSNLSEVFLLCCRFLSPQALERRQVQRSQACLCHKFSRAVIAFRKGEREGTGQNHHQIYDAGGIF